MMSVSVAVYTQIIQFLNLEIIKKRIIAINSLCETRRQMLQDWVGSE
jgi:hypothetical protein